MASFLWADLIIVGRSRDGAGLRSAVLRSFGPRRGLPHRHRLLFFCYSKYSILFEGSLARTEASRTVVGVGLFNLGLGVNDKGTARDDRLMQWTASV